MLRRIASTAVTELPVTTRLLMGSKAIVGRLSHIHSAIAKMPHNIPARTLTGLNRCSAMSNVRQPSHPYQIPPSSLSLVTHKPMNQLSLRHKSSKSKKDKPGFFSSIYDVIFDYWFFWEVELPAMIFCGAIVIGLAACAVMLIVLKISELIDKFKNFILEYRENRDAKIIDEAYPKLNSEVKKALEDLGFTSEREQKAVIWYLMAKAKVDLTTYKGSHWDICLQIISGIDHAKKTALSSDGISMHMLCKLAEDMASSTEKQVEYRKLSLDSDYKTRKDRQPSLANNVHTQFQHKVNEKTSQILEKHNTDVKDFCVSLNSVSRCA